MSADNEIMIYFNTKINSIVVVRMDKHFVLMQKSTITMQNACNYGEYMYICQILKINKDWLLNGIGEMENNMTASQSAKILAELYDIAKGLSEEGQLYLLDTVKALKQRLSRKKTTLQTTVEEAEAKYIKSRSRFAQNPELTASNTIEGTDNKIAG